MYLEFLILMLDYFKTLTKRILIFEWVFPIVITVIVMFLNCESSYIALVAFKENSINIIGILLGFSIAIITIITTGGGKNIENIKLIKTKILIGKKALSLFEVLLINFTYSVVIEILIILGCLVMPLMSSFIYFNGIGKIISYSILVFSVLHILLLTLRNLTDFYFIVTKR